MTRKSIGATFEGETRDADGMAWTDCELEGITNEVSTLQPREVDLRTDQYHYSSGIFGPSQANLRMYYSPQ